MEFNTLPRSGWGTVKPLVEERSPMDSMVGRDECSVLLNVMSCVRRVLVKKIGRKAGSLKPVYLVD